MKVGDKYLRLVFTSYPIPEIRFPASPHVRNAQKSDFRSLRAFGMPGNQIYGFAERRAYQSMTLTEAPSVIE